MINQPTKLSTDDKKIIPVTKSLQQLSKICKKNPGCNQVGNVPVIKNKNSPANVTQNVYLNMINVSEPLHKLCKTVLMQLAPW